jgi:hypothetical protein
VSIFFYPAEYATGKRVLGAVGVALTFRLPGGGAPSRGLALVRSISHWWGSLTVPDSTHDVADLLNHGGEGA